MNPVKMMFGAMVEVSKSPLAEGLGAALCVVSCLLLMFIMRELEEKRQARKLERQRSKKMWVDVTLTYNR